jgi:3-oxoacyl-[acyl-carrier-protein] synthase III
MGWDPKSVGALIFVSQSADYPVPATACVSHLRLGLSKDCAAFDVNLGSSGFPYGLWMLASFMKASSIKRGIVMVGDNFARWQNAAALKDNRDESAWTKYLTLGDAGSAVALELDDQAGAMYSVINAMGAAFQKPVSTPEYLKIQPARKKPSEPTSFRHFKQLYEDHELSDLRALEFPDLFQTLYAESGWKPSEIDWFVFNQFGKKSHEELCQKLGIDLAKAPTSYEDYGNTLGASIPVTIVSRLRAALASGKQKIAVAGSGLGLTYGAIAMEVDRPTILEVQTVRSEELQGGWGSWLRI